MKLKKDNKDKKNQFKYIDSEGNSKVIENFGTLKVEQIQELIKKVIYWYTVKFPNNDLIIDNNKAYIKNTDEKINSDYMTIEQFSSRLSTSVASAFECKYIGDYYFNFFNFDNKIKDLYNDFSYVFIALFNNDNSLFKPDYNKDCLIVSDNDGKILSLIGDNLLLNEIRKNYKDINLEQLLSILKESKKNNLNFYYLEECIKNRKRDIAVRDKIINIIAKELLFNATEIEYGYFRASHFLNDFNTLYNLNLDSSYLDGIIRKYKNKQNTLKKGTQCDKKNKSLVKSKKSCYG